MAAVSRLVYTGRSVTPSGVSLSSDDSGFPRSSFKAAFSHALALSIDSARHRASNRRNILGRRYVIIVGDSLRRKLWRIPKFDGF